VSGRALVAVVAAAALGAVPGRRLGAQDVPDTVRLSALVVTATRLPTPLSATTAAVTVVGGAELRARGIRTVAEALRLVPGAVIVETGPVGGATSLFLRGGESDYVRVLLDGVPLNEAGGAYDFANLTTDDVERIEVVRGPASVLYGSDAVSGVVQLFTRRGTGPARWAAGARAGSYGTAAYDLQLGGGGRAAGYTLSVSRFATDGVYSFNNGYRSTVAAGSARLRPDRATEARLTVRYTDDVYHYPTDGSGNVLYHRQFQAGRVAVASLDAGRVVAPGIEVRVLLGGTEAIGRQDKEPEGPADTLGYYGFWSFDRASRRSADVRLNLAASPAAVLTAGASLETEAERSRNVTRSQFGPDSGALVVSRWDRAFYAEAVAGGRGPLALTAGVRVEENQAFGGFFTYRAGAAYRWGATRLRVAAGSAFKEPSFFENYATGYVTGNADLRPERSRSVEVGVERGLAGGRVVVGATWFAQRFRDLIQYTFAPPVAGGANYFNVAGANASGIEVEATVAPWPALDLVARYTYLRTEAADSGFDGATYAAGKRLLRRPAHQASVAATYRAGGATASVTAQYVGERDDEDFSVFPGARVVLPAYVRVDLAGAVPLVRAAGARPGVTATWRFENLLGARYEQVLHFPARGRAFFAGVRLEGGM
jgi:vitamin B12 transporter